LHCSIKDNNEKIKLNKQLPYLVSNVIEILDLDAVDPDEEEDGGAVDVTAQKKDKCVVIKTSTRQTGRLCVGVVSSRRVLALFRILLPNVLSVHPPLRLVRRRQDVDAINGNV
jgi:ATP-dependent 26S proteasome regulatory subunit